MLKKLSFGIFIYFQDFKAFILKNIIYTWLRKFKLELLLIYKLNKKFNRNEAIDEFKYDNLIWIQNRPMNVLKIIPKK